MNTPCKVQQRKTVNIGFDNRRMIIRGITIKHLEVLRHKAYYLYTSQALLVRDRYSAFWRTVASYKGMAYLHFLISALYLDLLMPRCEDDSRMFTIYKVLST